MGFSTVSFDLQGAFTHQDFAGHKGTIRTGDVQVQLMFIYQELIETPVCIGLDLILYGYMQWMTAGRGIIHSEMPAGDGAQKGLQLWINLASKDKM